MSRTCGVVRGCVFAPVGDGPGILFFYTYHTSLIPGSPHTISLLYCCLVRADDLVRG